MTTNDRPSGPKTEGGPQWKDVPIDWEALEDAFENNAPEVHSYLHVPTGDVLRIVDGVADPQMHARIAGDINYLRIEPVSSREQYRWMERYIPMVEDDDLQNKLTRAIDGKGAFRRFKDVLMGYGPERERWFAFRSERLRIFMEAWLNAHCLNPVKRVVWVPELVEEQPSQPRPASAVPGLPGVRRTRSADTMRRQLRDLIEALGPRELDHLATFAEFLGSRRAARQAAASQPEGDSDAGEESQPKPSAAEDELEPPSPSSSKVAKRAAGED
jgi:hypothetical protein